jgi:hypothetical protein
MRSFSVNCLRFKNATYAFYCGLLCHHQTLKETNSIASQFARGPEEAGTVFLTILELFEAAAAGRSFLLFSRSEYGYKREKKGRKC